MLILVLTVLVGFYIAAKVDLMDAARRRCRAHAGAPGGASCLRLAVATIAGAFAFQAAGYAPCELCLKERLALLRRHRARRPHAGAGAFRAAGPRPRRVDFARAAFPVLGRLRRLSRRRRMEMVGRPHRLHRRASTRPTSNADFLQQLQRVHVVRCDAVAIRILGLSLAGWNAIVSLDPCRRVGGGREALADHSAGVGRLRPAPRRHRLEHAITSDQAVEQAGRDVHQNQRRRTT